MIDVRVCSNAPRVELLLDGKPVGDLEIDHEERDAARGMVEDSVRCR